MVMKNYLLFQVSLVSAEGKQQFCSLWLKALPKEEDQEVMQEEEKEEETRKERGPRWVAVLEPVEVLTSKVGITTLYQVKILLYIFFLRIENY